MRFEDILITYGVPYATESHRHTREGWVNFDCPYCGVDSQKWHMGYNIAGRYTNCWRCGKHSVAEVLRDAARITLGEAIELVKQIDDNWAQITPSIKGELKLPKGLCKLQKAHRRYLKERRFDADELVKLWRLQGTAYSSWRIFIPIEFQSRVVSFTMRAIGNIEPRYVNAAQEHEEMHAKHLLFGEDYARHAIIIVEGCFDAFRIGPGAVATLGTSYTQAQLCRMTKYPIRVVCFDAEREAQQRASRLCDDLEAFPGDTYNVRLKAKDPAEASRREIKSLRAFLA